MVIRHKKNTLYYLAVPMVDSATPANFKTGLSPTDTAYYKDGAGAWTALGITDTFAEIGSTGVYEIDLTAAELNHDQVIIKLTSAGAADSLVIFEMDSIEIDDIPTTAMRGTDNAALASVCTEARLAELAAANMPADVDTLKTRCTEARLAELDAANLPTDIAAIPLTPMRGTDNAALASVCTEIRLAELAAANLPADIAAIPLTPMRGTDNAALASVCTEARLAELAAANLPADCDTLKTRCTEARLAELDAANLPTDVAAIPTTPALASVCTEARLAELDAANLPAHVAAIPTTPALASVCTEARLAELDAANLPAVTDGIKTKTDALPASWQMTDLAAVPAINTSIVEALNFVYVLCRNKKITNKTTKEIELYKDNSSTKFSESDIDDDGTLFTQGKFGAVD